VLFLVVVMQLVKNAGCFVPVKILAEITIAELSVINLSSGMFNPTQLNSSQPSQHMYSCVITLGKLYTISCVCHQTVNGW